MLVELARGIIHSGSPEETTLSRHSGSPPPPHRLVLNGLSFVDIPFSPSCFSLFFLLSFCFLSWYFLVFPSPALQLSHLHSNFFKRNPLYFGGSPYSLPSMCQTQNSLHLTLGIFVPIVSY